jgi:acetyltransferase-like isoleucine patch superfamily enzyme
MSRAVRGLLYILDWWQALPWPPPVRAWWLRRYGATIGAGAVIHRSHYMNLEVAGFRNLTVGERAHIGPECLLDLASNIWIGDRAALAPRVTVLTHADPGESALQERYPREAAPTTIDEDAWVGAGATLLHGVNVGARAVVGAGSLVRGKVPADGTVAGVPARAISSASQGGDAE